MEYGVGNFSLVNGKIKECNYEMCHKCAFAISEECTGECTKWLYAEYEEPAINWAKVPIDAKIIITMPNGNKMRRHFAGLSEDGKPCYFAFGRDSWVNDEAARIMVQDGCTVEIVEE